eukprot:6381577-Prymnesium_polylepis.1
MSVLFRARLPTPTSHNATVHVHTGAARPISQPARNNTLAASRLRAMNKTLVEAAVDGDMQALIDALSGWRVRARQPAVAELLVNAGADLAVLNRGGLTPLEIAEREENEGVIAILK